MTSWQARPDAAFHRVGGFTLLITSQYHAAAAICAELLDEGGGEGGGGGGRQRFDNGPGEFRTVTAADATAAARAFLQRGYAKWRRGAGPESATPAEPRDAEQDTRIVQYGCVWEGGGGDRNIILCR